MPANPLFSGNDWKAGDGGSNGQGGTYKLDGGVGEKNAILDNFVFVVGETKLLQVVDTKHAMSENSKVVDAYHIGAPGTDVATCKTADERLVAVATQGMNGKADIGRVMLFTVDDTGVLTHKKTYTTGTDGDGIKTSTHPAGRLPDQIKWTRDCRAIIAACEGEAVPMENKETGKRWLDNPEGGIAFIKFHAPSKGPVTNDTAAVLLILISDFVEFVWQDCESLS